MSIGVGRLDDSERPSVTQDQKRKGQDEEAKHSEATHGAPSDGAGIVGLGRGRSRIRCRKRRRRCDHNSIASSEPGNPTRRGCLTLRRERNRPPPRRRSLTRIYEVIVFERRGGTILRHRIRALRTTQSAWYSFQPTNQPQKMERGNAKQDPR